MQKDDLLFIKTVRPQSADGILMTKVAKTSKCIIHLLFVFFKSISPQLKPCVVFQSSFCADEV